MEVCQNCGAEVQQLIDDLCSPCDREAREIAAIEEADWIKYNL